MTLRHRSRLFRPGALLVAAATAAGVAVAVLPPAASAAAAAPPPCGTTTDTEYATGTTAAAIGWPGNSQAVVSCLSGSFVVINNQRLYGFGVYNGSRTTWTNAEGYLPAITTGFRSGSAPVSITNFADDVTIGGHAFVVVYSRVSVTNPGTRPVTVDPQASSGLTALNNPSNTVNPGRTVSHDYAVVSDKFGGSYANPTAGQLVAAGGYSQHYTHMRSYWVDQVNKLAQIRALPDPSLINAYRSGFVYTQLTRADAMLKTGVNGYDKEYSHDVIGILANMLNQGFTTDGTTTAVDLLLRLRSAVGSQAQYDDGIWKYAWPWALYLQKTGDAATVRNNFNTPGPQGHKLEPSIKDSAHEIAADRTGPGGIMHNTPDIDSDGFWVIDNYSALTGLAAYRWLAGELGYTSEYTWASNEYSSLLGAVNQTLVDTINKYHLNYIPCSMVEPNTANRCGTPQDANWAAPFLFGRWAWDGYLFDAPINGPGYDLIDATYKYGFDRLRGILPPHTYGGYGDTEYSTGYNAGYGEWGLASNNYRSEGIYGYQFMIRNTQSGPYAWWESVQAPDPNSPWVGNHPAAGAGSSPHAWGAADANLVLLSSLIAERGDGTVIVGRGVPNSWVRTDQRIEVANMPVNGGGRVGVTVVTRGTSVSLTITGNQPGGPILFQLPAFVNNLISSTAGSIDPATGTVTLSASTRTVTVKMAHTV